LCHRRSSRNPSVEREQGASRQTSSSSFVSPAKRPAARSILVSHLAPWWCAASRPAQRIASSSHLPQRKKFKQAWPPRFQDCAGPFSLFFLLLLLLLPSYIARLFLGAAVQTNPPGLGHAVRAQTARDRSLTEEQRTIDVSPRPIEVTRTTPATLFTGHTPFWEQRSRFGGCNTKA
jgi:hypothetical protein